MRVGGSGFALGDEVERSRRIAAWSGVLAASAREGGALHRLQWIVRCLPGGSRALASGRAQRPRHRRSAATRSLLERAAPVLWRHEVLVALSVRGRSSPGRAAQCRRTGRRIVDELNAFERRCVAAGLEVDGALSRRRRLQPDPGPPRPSPGRLAGSPTPGPGRSGSTRAGRRLRTDADLARRLLDRRLAAQRGRERLPVAAHARGRLAADASR